MRFLSIGECMGELAPTGDVDLYRFGFAGDTYNTAWYLRRLRPDIDVEYCTAIGRDEVSDRMLEAFAGHGIGTTFVTRRSDRSIGLYMITLRDGERSFAYWRSASAARLLAEDAACLDDALGWADTVYFSGITLAILENGGRARLLAALGAARARGARVAFDPNLRPRLWGSRTEMTGAIMEAAGHADLILPTFDDDAAAFGDADPRATAQRYAAASAGTVLVKNGARPVWILGDGLDEARPVRPAERVVDTTAAGDSFNAAIIDAVSESTPLPQAVARAADVASRVIAARGALVDPLSPT